MKKPIIMSKKTNNPELNFSNKELITGFQNIRKLNILVIGDLILDEYIWGNSERISPEAPVPIVEVTRHENRIGGAGNVAANLASLDCKVDIVGVCGEDHGNKILKQMFDSQNIKHFIFTSSDRGTTKKSRIIARQQQLVRIDEENTREINPEILDKIVNSLINSKKTYDGLILSDYKKGLLGPDFIQKILSHFHDIPVIIDPKGYNYSLYRYATCIKPNFNEFCAAINRPDLQKSEIKQYAKQMVSDLKLKGIVITLGEDGVFILDNNGDSCIIPTEAKEVYDVSGAGDTFIATFSAGLILTKNWFQAAKMGNIASGIAVGKVGTSTISIEEIDQYCNLK